MKKLKIVFVSLALLVFPELNQAQKAWSLEECINYAIENNISVKRQELNAELAQKTNFQSKMEVLPSVSARGTHYLNSGKTLNTEDYSYVDDKFQGGNVGLSSQVTIFKGLQNFNNIRRTKVDLLSQLERVEKVKNDITINVTTAYLQILLNNELKQIASYQLKVTLEQIEKTKRLVEIGNAAKGDLLQIEAQSASEKAALTNAENNLRIAYLDLTQLLNLEGVEDFNIVFPEIKEIISTGNISNVDKIYQSAIDFLPEIKSAELDVKSSKLNLAISKGRISPRLSLGYEYSSRYSELNKLLVGSEGGQSVYADSYPYLDQIQDNSSKMVYLRLSIPIFSNWQVGSSISKAKVNLADSKLNLDLQKQNLYKSIQQARAQAVAALDRYQANLEAVEANTEAFRYTEQRFQVGLVDIVEYKLAKNNLNKAKSDLSQSKYEYIFRTKILDFYVGEQIQL
ncbi:MAG: TolC family protein [Bacteroidales bacterium]|nr:TolC family protein [Bacteroidales bacterium]